MRYLKGVLSTIVSSIILFSEGSPLTYFIDYLNLPLFLKSPILYLLVWIIAGIISGSKYVGSISSSIVILLDVFTPILLFEGASLYLELLSYYIQKIGLIQILSIITGGYFGGFFISKHFDEEDYIILKVDEDYRWLMPIS
jgi:hypothetical protein